MTDLAARDRSEAAVGAVRLRRLGVVARSRHDGLASLLERVQRFGREHGLEVRYDGDNVGAAPDGSRALALDDEPVDLVLALGGDGTFLRASRMAAGSGIPVLGINVGHLGFLTSAGEPDLEAALARVAERDFVLDHRFMLRAEVVSVRGEVTGTFMALNDFVVHKAGMARMTRIDLHVGEGSGRDVIGSFSADGVIVATPTGSTAYSMSAGGPIIVPDVECIVITAICPHTLAVRPLVIPAREHLRIQATDRPEDLVLTVDGQEGKTLAPGDEVVVARSDVSIPIVRFPGQTFFQTLRRKLHWAVRSTDDEAE